MLDISVSRLTIADSVSRQVIQLILEKKLKPGDRLPSQRDLSLQLAVGRPAIREALERLEAMGVIRVQHGKSTTVEKVDPDKIMSSVSPVLQLIDTDVLQLLEAKEIIETRCVELAAKRASKFELNEMKHYLEEMRKNRTNPQKHAGADFLFHFTIVKSARNPIIIETMKIIGRMLLKAIEQTAVEDDLAGRDKAMIYHESIYNAIRDKDGAKAAGILHKHSRESRRRYASACRKKSKHG